MFFACIYVWVPCVYRAWGGQKRVSDLLELKLKIVGAGNQTWGLWKNSTSSQWWNHCHTLKLHFKRITREIFCHCLNSVSWGWGLICEHWHTSIWYPQEGWQIFQVSFLQMNHSTDIIFDMLCVKLSYRLTIWSILHKAETIRNTTIMNGCFHWGIYCFKLFSYLLSTKFKGTIQASCHSQAKLRLPLWTLDSISRATNLLGVEKEHLTSMKASGRHQDLGPT